MGDEADDVVDGSSCEECLTPLGGATGYPRKCNECKSPQKVKKERKVKPKPKAEDNQLGLL